MTNKHPQTEEEHTAQTRSRFMLVALVGILLAVVAFSLTTNLNRMWNKWEDQGSDRGKNVVAALKLERVEAVSGERRHSFMVELARTEAERGRGLMFRQSMPQDHGMLFDFERDQIITMWMKNTFISLDMVFIFADGRIHRIESRTEPESEKTISSGVPVRAVLELNAGVASRLGLRAGDRIQHSMFK